MSSVPGSAGPDLWFVLATAVTATGGIYWWSSVEEARPGTIVAECSDGSVIGTIAGKVRRRPGRTAAHRAKLAAHHPGLEADDVRRATVDDLSPGALSFARVRAGQGTETHWVLEGLSAVRDRIRIAWEFDSEDDARRTLRLLDERIVRSPLAANRSPVRVTEANLDVVLERERLEDERQTWERERPEDTQG